MVSLDLGNFRSWQPQQFATYMRDTHNLGAYYEAIISNGIGGDTAPQLTENDLKVGINVRVCMRARTVVVVVVVVVVAMTGFHRHAPVPLCTFYLEDLV